MNKIRVVILIVSLALIGITQASAFDAISRY